MEEISGVSFGSFTSKICPTTRVPLQSLLATSDLDVSEAVLDRLTTFGPSTEEERLASLRGVFLRRHGVSLSSPFKGDKLLSYLFQSIESFDLVSSEELLAVLLSGIRTAASPATLRLVLLRLQERFSAGEIICDPSLCPWATLLQLVDHVPEYAASVSPLLAEFKLTSPSIQCPFRVGSVPPSVLLDYMRVHSNRSYAPSVTQLQAFCSDPILFASLQTVCQLQEYVLRCPLGQSVAPLDRPLPDSLEGLVAVQRLGRQSLLRSFVRCVQHYPSCSYN